MKLLVGGPIYPLPGRGSVEALLLDGPRVVRAGSLSACREAGPGAVEVDLGNRTVMPGFVDAHCHPLMFGQTLTWVDCSPGRASSIDAIVDALTAVVASLPRGATVRGFGYNPLSLAEQRNPTAADLDRVSSTTPVYLMNASGHGGVANSALMRQAGITDDTPTPSGGTIERDPSGKPTGVFWDAACDLLTGADGVKVGNHGPNFHLPDSPTTLKNQLITADEYFLSRGITSVGDAQVTARELGAYVSAARSLNAKYSMYFLSSSLPEVIDGSFGKELTSSRQWVAGVKLYVDGAFSGRTAFLPEGYVSDPCCTGMLYHPWEEYASLVETAHRAGIQTASHAQGSAAIALVIAAVRSAVLESPHPDSRHRVEHAGLITFDQIRQLVRLAMIPVTQPEKHLRYGENVMAAVGRVAGGRFNPYGDYVRAGADVVLSSDAPVSAPHPLREIAAAVNRRTPTGEVLGGLGLRMSRRNAIIAHTRAAARALRRETRIGSLAPGRDADLAVLARDPHTVPQGEIGDIEVEETWIDGEPVFTKG